MELRSKMEKLAEDRAERLHHAVSVKTDKPILIPIRKGFYEFDIKSQQKLQIKTVVALRADMCECGEEPLADKIIYERVK